jgi:L-fuconolactonase
MCGHQVALKTMTERVDAHHHLWEYDAEEYAWISEEMRGLRRDFLLTDFQNAMVSANIQSAITVQARQSLEETNWLLQIADESSVLRGVVGWAPLINADFPIYLEKLMAAPKLKGLRHVLQDEPDDTYMLQQSFNSGISALTHAGLVYDILIYQRHLPYAVQLVDRHPSQVFVLDHFAKPPIRERQVSPWREQLQDLAKRPNISCKLSGLTTEADWNSWTIDDLWPYFEVALECFGPERLMAGSDWPVCTVATSYDRWWSTLCEMISALSTDEQDAILGGNAARIYNLGTELQ